MSWKRGWICLSKILSGTLQIDWLICQTHENRRAPVAPRKGAYARRQTAAALRPIAPLIPIILDFIFINKNFLYICLLFLQKNLNKRVKGLCPLRGFGGRAPNVLSFHSAFTGINSKPFPSRKSDQRNINMFRNFYCHFCRSRMGY